MGRYYAVSDHRDGIAPWSLTQEKLAFSRFRHKTFVLWSMSAEADLFGNHSLTIIKGEIK